ncbi:MAG: hypothetical protein MZU84_05170 [Sphingobacterium sp.]|nr:hypothetical protein [Sphingobacterium sp.]
MWNPLRGKVLWEYNDWLCHISVPSAVDAGNNKVLVAGGYEHGVVMLKVEKKSDGTFGVTELIHSIMISVIIPNRRYSITGISMRSLRQTAASVEGLDLHGHGRQGIVEDIESPSFR